MNDKKNYKWSMFNVETKDKHGNLLLVNTITNTFFRFSPKRENENLILEISQDLLNKLSCDDFETLVKHSVLVEGKKNEREVVDDIFQNYVVENPRLDLVVFTTNRCNFSCVYCPQKREFYTLSLEQCDILISFIEKEIDEHNYKNMRLRLFGGEPLLNKEAIFYFLDKLDMLSKRKGITYGGGLTTNGYLLDIETLKRLYRYNMVSYQISIDGLPEVKHRLLNDGTPSFDKILDNLIAIRDRVKYSMLNITIRLNFTDELMGRLDEIVDFFEKEFSKDRRFCFSFIPVYDLDYKDTTYMKGETVKKKLVDSDTVTAIKKQYAKRLDFRAWTDLLFTRVGCWSGTKHGYVVNANGDIIKCEFVTEDFAANKIGEIKEKNVIIDIEKEKPWLFNSPMNECYDCECFPICLSTCCGAVRVQNIMHRKCPAIRKEAKNNLEIEAYSERFKFIEIQIDV